MISSYYFKGFPPEQWELEETLLSNINLFVGASGSGKTRFLNTLCNLSEFVSKGEPFRPGYWRITAITNEHEYRWEFQCGANAQGSNEIIREVLEQRRSGSQEDFEILIKRTSEAFSFHGNALPKLQADKPGVTLLKEEEVIKPFYEIFTRVHRRKFQEEGLIAAVSLSQVTQEQVSSIKSHGMSAMWKQDPPLSVKMFLLKEHFSDLYQISINAFKQVFTSIIDCDVKWSKEFPAGGQFPLLAIKEKGVDGWVPLPDLSSGMQKVLLIISDIISLPKGSIYIIDEYENSLGVNAIDFLPQFLLDHGDGIQFLVTTHHPYLINSMPMKSWKVFHRTGSRVMIKDGAEFEQRYGKSKQQAFIQLMNDPFYSGIA